MRLEYLSNNIVIILEEILKISNIDLYLGLPSNQLFLNKLFPYPFDPKTETDEQCQVRVYYPNIEFKNAEVIEDTTILFDIVCSKTLWLAEGKKIRPYEIASLIVNHFNNNSISTIGQINFIRAIHVFINDKYDAIRLQAKIMTIGS